MRHAMLTPAASSSGWARVIGLLTLAVLVLPFLSLLFTTPWLHLHFQPGDADAVLVSIAYTLVALAIVVFFGTPLALWLARNRFPGKALVDGLMLLPLLAPPWRWACCWRSSSVPTDGLANHCDVLGWS